jgi:hypothetical protein
MALNLVLWTLAGSLIGWTIIIFIMIKIVCQRNNEISMIEEIKTGLKSIRNEIQSLRKS